MTYDDWKLETPEDEADRRAHGRKGWRDYRDTERCWHCKEIFKPEEDDEECCARCGAHADPDDARDDMMDRDYNR